MAILSPTSVQAQGSTHSESSLSSGIGSQSSVPDGSDPNLPQPPTNEQKYEYYSCQHRWLLTSQLVSFMLIAWSITRFSVSHPYTLLFLIPMSLYIVTMVISFISSSRRRRYTLEEHLQLVSTYESDLLLSVDVFLPSAGEPLDLLENTYKHVRNLEWDGELKVYVLDDSDRYEVRQLAAKYNFHYGVRANRGHLKKAGNLFYGWDNSSGDFILVLDADFAPRHDMLKEMVPHFRDSTVGIVQTPQYFDSSHNGMGWLQRCAGATQELFYRWIQPSRDASNAAICVGTCALYRRSALVESGGFAQIGHSEDVHTGVNLLRVGYYVRYVPVVLSKGICPDEVSSFLNQQYRWCAGSMSLLADKTFHKLSYLNVRMRMCYWSGFLYYISTAVNAIIAPLPAIVMVYFFPDWVKPVNSIWFIGAILLWFVILPSIMRGGWRPDVLRVQYLYSFAHLLAIMDTVFGSTREWVATGTATKRKAKISDTVKKIYTPYICLVQVVLWVGLVSGVLRHGLENYWAMLFFGFFSIYIQVPILLASRGARK